MEPSVAKEAVADITADFSCPASVASEQDDELYEEARSLVISSQLVSTSVHQGKLAGGFARAGLSMVFLVRPG